MSEQHCLECAVRLSHTASVADFSYSSASEATGWKGNYCQLRLILCDLRVLRVSVVKKSPNSPPGHSAAKPQQKWCLIHTALPPDVRRRLCLAVAADLDIGLCPGSGSAPE